jgi:predicted cupin superfamily sugar epimerase
VTADEIRRLLDLAPHPEGGILLGTTVAPGFDFADYETGARAELQRAWPACAALGAALTPEAR